MEPQQTSDTVAHFDRVALRYGRGPEILRDVSLELPAGSFHFLVGPCGAGKTSLLRLLYLRLLPSRGRVLLFGTDVGRVGRAELAALRRRIGIVFQDFRLLPQLTLLDNVALPMRIAGGDDATIRHDAIRLLERVGLKHLAHATPPALSGGQQQLAAIARAVIARPRLLIADEPTASVDGALAVRLILLFQEMNRLGTTVLIATHNERLADRFPHPRLRLEGGCIHGGITARPGSAPPDSALSSAHQRREAAAEIAL
ncbi:MAG: ATP-binding cassette domain-containing protein [Rhodospirillales bacterium]|nr:ATP-binding cassette domain-containing protein [Rhodospirillales bacterium]